MLLFTIQFYFFFLVKIRGSPNIEVKKPLPGALFKFRGGDRDLLRANFGLFANAGGDPFARETFFFEGAGLIFFPFGAENLFGFLGADFLGDDFLEIPLNFFPVICSTVLGLCTDNNCAIFAFEILSLFFGLSFGFSSRPTRDFPRGVHLFHSVIL
jgi:hypothetical protein